MYAYFTLILKNKKIYFQYTLDSRKDPRLKKSKDI